MKTNTYNTQIVDDYIAVRIKHDDIEALLRSKLRPNPTYTHVDLACGACTETAFLANCVQTFIGIDASQAMLEIARASIQGTFVCADITDKIPLDSNIAHTITLLYALHHVKDLNQFLTETRRILKDGGILLIVTNSPEQIKKRQFYRVFPTVFQYNLKRFRPLKVIEYALTEHGFCNIKLGELRRPPTNFDEERLQRLETGALDSALWCLSTDEWRIGINNLRYLLKKGEHIPHCRDRLWITATKGT